MHKFKKSLSVFLALLMILGTFTFNGNINVNAEESSYEGVSKVNKTSEIKVAYDVKLSVKVDEDKVLEIIDNGTNPTSTNDIYWTMVSKILADYSGKEIAEVKTKSLSELGIDVVTNATVSCEAIHIAVQDALSKIDDSNEEDSDEWVESDFNYFESTCCDEVKGIYITSLSESGLAKQKLNHELILPNKITGINVVCIDKNAFTNANFDPKTQFTSVKLPENLLEIRDGAFSGNALSELELPEGLIDIQQNAFCYNEITEVIIPNSVKSIGLNAFAGNKLSQGSVKIDNFEGEVLIGFEAFDKQGESYDVSVKPVYLKVEEPEEKEWTVEDFSYDIAVDKLKVSGFTSTGEAKFEELGSDVPVVFPVIGTDGKEVIGIADYTFYNEYLGIKNIEIPEGYKIIGEGCFVAEDIEEVYLPESIESVAEDAFIHSDYETIAKLHVKTVDQAEMLGSGDYWEVVVDEAEEPAWSATDFVFSEVEYEMTDGSTIKLNTVLGLSEAGLEKLKTNMDLELPKLDNDGKVVKVVGKNAFQGQLNEQSIKSLVVPEGYEFIDSMAFAFCGIEGEIKLPQSLEGLGMAAFFRNEITKVNIPAKMTIVSLSAFRGNKLSEIVFDGDLEIIGRLAFSQNRLEEITVPDSLKSIGEQAFEANTGNAKFNDKVIIRTESGNNPNNLPNKENYLIDPIGEGEDPNIDYNNWYHEDFEYDGQTLVGFSEKGIRKNKKNKKLFIPDGTPDEKDLLVIGIDAFRNFSDLDLESVVLPETVVSIENYAFQFNDIKKFTMPRDLKYMGYGVFMMTGLEELEWNEKIEEIDQICFYDSKLGDVTIPKSVKYIRDASFRKAGINSLQFEKGSQLKEISRLAFADNNISELELPDGIEKIDGDGVFSNNKIKEITVPDSLIELGFQTFLNNQGVDEYNNVVVVNTIDSKNINNLPDDIADTYIVDPKVYTSIENSNLLKSLIEEAEKVDADKLTDGSKYKTSKDSEFNKDYKGLFLATLTDAKYAYGNKSTSNAEALRYIKELKFYLSRVEINSLMNELDNMDKNSYDADLWQEAISAYENADRYFMVYNLSDRILTKYVNDLKVVIAALKGEKPFEGADVYEGQITLPEPYHNVETYDVKVKVWVKDGVIMYVKDNGTVCDDPEGEEDHNAGYWRDAQEIMISYVGKTVKDVMDKNLVQNGIDIVSGATISCVGIHDAVRDALSKIEAGEEPNNDGNSSSAYYPESDIDVKEIAKEETPLSKIKGAGYIMSEKEALAKYNRFVDVDTLWAKQYILDSVRRGLIAGTSATTFSPRLNTTRAELFTILHRMSGKAKNESAKVWYQPAMTWSKSRGLSDGLRPMDKVTREEIAKAIYEFVGSPKVNKSLNNYKDQNDISKSARKAMEWAVEKKLIYGRNGDKLCPKGYATRAELLAIIVRLLTLK